MNMKKTIGMLLAAGIVGLSTAVLSAVSVGGRVPAPRTAGSVNAGLDLMPDIVSGLNLLAGEKYETIPSANGIGVWNGEEVVPMDTEDYIIHVTAAEMPATYEKEALKAQAVAARTFAMKHLTGELRCKSGHTICTDYACCQAFLTTEQLRERWGSSFEDYYARIEAAVHETEGLVLTSGGELVTALYHSSSGGRTENCEAVFAVALPYLVSVESGGEEDSPEFTSEKCYTTAEFISKVNSAFPDAQMSDPIKVRQNKTLDISSIKEMDYKKSKAPVNTVTRNLRDLWEPTGNIYESVAIIAKRANQISVEIKQDLSKKLSEFASYNDSLDEVFENREQIEISRFYEKLPKPTLLATQEFLDGNIYWRDPSKKDDEFGQDEEA